MHKYLFHIGDYLSATGHLSDLEDLAYRRLLDLYYDTEGPLPADCQWLARRMRLDCQHIENVLHEFFRQTENGWVHDRCDAEIRTFKRICERNKANAKQGWERKERQPHASRMPPACQPHANHKPKTINHKDTKSKALSGIPEIENENAAKPESKNGLHKRQAVEVLEFLNAKTGHRYKAVDANLKPIMCRLGEGFTVQDCKSVVAMKRREWQTDEHMAKYLRPATLFNRTNFANYEGQLFHADPAEPAQL